MPLVAILIFGESTRMNWSFCFGPVGTTMPPKQREIKYKNKLLTRPRIQLNILTVKKKQKSVKARLDDELKAKSNRPEIGHRESH